MYAGDPGGDPIRRHVSAHGCGMAVITPDL